MNATVSSTDVPNYQLSAWARWFASDNRFHSFTLTNDALLFYDNKRRKHAIELLRIHPVVSVESGWFWDVLVFGQEGGKSIRFGGVNKAQSTQIRLFFKRHVSNSSPLKSHKFTAKALKHNK
ncbi:hypothetical protein [Methylomonas fluvii]|uniref:Uncharacterized protein n=1 Tax=Methylomonas fluvii TaxID=1854564 RepID=A0ABR9D9Y9_9GAMM|nr:hypothetical protein [Methylomonas fluvii]MBD9359930.1 hypothetical protein [Methylomonas fluvii]CAD6872709.1 hypothetical protein [Methylomonas fluvii]